MTEAIVSTFFVSEKVAKVRWVPEELMEVERFLTGSWDMPVNFVRIWRLQCSQYREDYNDFAPRCSDKVQFPGDVTGLELVTDDVVAASCSDGHISLLKIKRAVEADTLNVESRSNLLHKIDDQNAVACTGLSVHDKEIATVGEDGCLNILDTKSLLSVRRTIKADSCALTAVAYVNQQEVLTANRMGVIRMFDVRAAAEVTATGAFMTSCEDEKVSNFVSCLTSHPTQNHVVLAGSEEGSITVWDLRQPGYPASYLSAHNSTITEIGFHRTDPSKLFTAAERGELWLWAQHPTMSGVAAKNLLEEQPTENINPWLSGERTKSRISVTSLMSDLRKSINTFDSDGAKIVCGGDGEAIYFIDNVF